MEAPAGGGAAKRGRDGAAAAAARGEPGGRGSLGCAPGQLLRSGAEGGEPAPLQPRSSPGATGGWREVNGGGALGGDAAGIRARAALRSAAGPRGGGGRGAPPCGCLLGLNRDRSEAGLWTPRGGDWGVDARQGGDGSRAGGGTAGNLIGLGSDSEGGGGERGTDRAPPSLGQQSSW